MILDFIDIVQTLALRAVEGIELDEDAALGHAADGGADAPGSGEVDVRLLSVDLHVAGLDDAPVRAWQVALTHLRGHVAEVEVGVSNLVQIHVLAEVGIRGIGSSQTDGLLVGQHAVAALPGAGSGEDVDLEGSSGLVLGVGFLGQFGGYGLGYAGRCEAREAQRVAILDLCCGFGSGDAFDHLVE